MSSKEDLLAETLLRNTINEMGNFPKANCDRKTIENSLRRFMGEKYSPYALDDAWENYCVAKQVSLINLLKK